jgi:hypothetical protein
MKTVKNFLPSIAELSRAYRHSNFCQPNQDRAFIKRKGLTLDEKHSDLSGQIKPCPGHQALPTTLKHRPLESPMRLIVLFNLRKDTDPTAYEEWSRTKDIPTVRALGSVAAFDVYRATGLLGSDATPPFQYIETIEVADDAAFGTEIGTEAMQQIAAEFQTFADNPQFVILRDITAPA